MRKIASLKTGTSFTIRRGSKTGSNPPPNGMSNETDTDGSSITGLLHVGKRPNVGNPSRSLQCDGAGKQTAGVSARCREGRCRNGGDAQRLIRTGASGVCIGPSCRPNTLRAGQSRNGNGWRLTLLHGPPRWDLHDHCEWSKKLRRLLGRGSVAGGRQAAIIELPRGVPTSPRRPGREPDSSRLERYRVLAARHTAPSGNFPATPFLHALCQAGPPGRPRRALADPATGQQQGGHPAACAVGTLTHSGSMRAAGLPG